MNSQGGGRKGSHVTYRGHAQRAGVSPTVAPFSQQIVQYLPMQSFTSFQTILQDVARRQGFDLKMVEYRLHARWKEVVGEVLAVHTSPSRIKFRKLYITVENSMWLHQLTFLKKPILEKIHSTIGPGLLTDLIFHVGEIPPRERSLSQDAPSPPHVSAEHMMVATECSRVIEDQNLRNTLTQVIAKALSTS